MRVLFLNVWGGQLKEALTQFLTVQKGVDIFCFQENSEEVDGIMQHVFPQYSGYRASKRAGFKSNFDQAIWVNPCFEVVKTEELLQSDNEAGLALAITLKLPNARRWALVNLHGTARQKVAGQFLDKDTKEDFPARLRQSQELLDFLNAQSNPVILGGDFNVLPHTQTVDIFRQAGYRDLISEYHIKTTRNLASLERFPIKYFHSDYVFLSDTLQVKSFVVPSVEISDHLPLILEI